MHSITVEPTRLMVLLIMVLVMIGANRLASLDKIIMEVISMTLRDNKWTRGEDTWKGRIRELVLSPIGP
jgi:hypothetical protein